MIHGPYRQRRRRLKRLKSHSGSCSFPTDEIMRMQGCRGYGDSHGDSNGDSCGYGMGMGIEMPSPRQPCENEMHGNASHLASAFEKETSSRFAWNCHCSVMLVRLNASTLDYGTRIDIRIEISSVQVFFLFQRVRILGFISWFSLNFTLLSLGSFYAVRNLSLVVAVT